MGTETEFAEYRQLAEQIQAQRDEAQSDLMDKLGCLQRVYWFLSDPQGWPWTAQDILDDVAAAIGAPAKPVRVATLEPEQLL